LKEEVGLRIKDLQLFLKAEKNNPCRRKGGTWHYWKLFNAEVEGEIQRSLEETK